MILYQNGEYKAFEELYARHSGRVYAYLKSKVSGPGDAEDLLQQSFLKVHRYRARFDSTLPFLPWLFSIVRNSLVDFLRKQKMTALEPEKVVAIIDKRSEAPNEANEQANLSEVLNLLPEEQRELIRLRFEEGLSFEEIAERSGINSVSARKRLSRTVQSLRKIISGSIGGMK